MADMKRTKADKKAEKAQYDKAPGSIGGEDYGYNTRMTLDHDMLEKMGVKKLPTVGSKMKVHALAHVVSTSEDHSTDGKKRRRVELQMHHMGVAPHRERGTDDDTTKGAVDAMSKALEKK